MCECIPEWSEIDPCHQNSVIKTYVGTQFLKDQNYYIGLYILQEIKSQIVSKYIVSSSLERIHGTSTVFECRMFVQ